MTTLEKLQGLLEVATREGLLDDLQGYCKNPDSINDVCDAVEECLRERKEAESYNPPEEFSGEDLIIRLPECEALFRCPCGGNVFRKSTVDPKMYRCNSCKAIFEGEK